MPIALRAFEITTLVLRLIAISILIAMATGFVTAPVVIILDSISADWVHARYRSRLRI